MFGRGNWAIYGIDKTQSTDFAAALSDEKIMLSVSQLAASAITRINKRDAVGINPFRRPRLDEGVELDYTSMERLQSFACLDEENKKLASVPNVRSQIDGSEGFAVGEEEFRLTPSVPLYGFWYVINEWKDVSDLASLKEQMSYLNFERPYKFLTTDDKKTLDAAATAQTAMKRKQFPVLIDLQNGRVYIENANKNTLMGVTAVLDELGIKTVPVAWKFGENWLKELFAKLYAESRYKDEFQRAAQDAARFAEEEREEIEDAEKRQIINNFFSMTELESGLWAGLTTPAGVKLHKTLAPITSDTAVTATTLLNVTPDAFVSSAIVTIQERNTAISKKTGEERIYRKDLVTFELSDQINQIESGAALLRAFDLPSFKKGIMREIRKTKQVPPLETFWVNWLQSMDEAVRTIETSLREALEIKDFPTGILPLYGDRNDEVIEVTE